MWNRLSDRGTHASNVRSPGEGSVGHHPQPGRWDTRCAPPAHSIPIYTVLCFANFVNANFTIRRENGSKSLTALGKKLSQNSEIVTLAHAAIGRGGVEAPRAGRPGPGDLVAGPEARCREVGTRADQPSRFDGAGDDVVHRLEKLRSARPPVTWL